VPQPGHTVKPDELVTFAAGHLADFKVPQYLVVRSGPLPRNPGGKVLKPLLREQTERGKPSAERSRVLHRFGRNTCERFR
jgi:acyl-CoA synthetase (AMP-forming)/AMP-acid ligase II